MPKFTDYPKKAINRPVRIKDRFLDLRSSFWTNDCFLHQISLFGSKIVILDQRMFFGPKIVFLDPRSFFAPNITKKTIFAPKSDIWCKNRSLVQKEDLRSKKTIFGPKRLLEKMSF